ncbi:sigma-70 family RNA polymerase sigma factor [Streptomyces lateritius]|uniref:Sigma-70 family RNA polymerase sigma factor n=1 Tax=Streptomyces lateritius TaxID=67313 RepID=A0ABW6Y845_9ACTN
MTGEQSAYPTPGTLTEEQAGRMLASMNEVIRAGEEMRRLRAEMIQVFVHLGWTQEKIARLTEMSQPAVSKQVAKHREGDAPAATGLSLSLDQHDTAWLEGRLWGLAEEIAEAVGDTARCTPYVLAVARGRKRFTPRTVDDLRRLVEEDLRRHRTELPAGYRDAYDTISRGLDLPPKTVPAPTVPPTASARRALACQVQRIRLQEPEA